MKDEKQDAKPLFGILNFKQRFCCIAIDTLLSHRGPDKMLKLQPTLVADNVMSNLLVEFFFEWT